VIDTRLCVAARTSASTAARFLFTKSPKDLYEKLRPVAACSTPHRRNSCHRHGPSAAAMTGLRPDRGRHELASCCSPSTRSPNKTWDAAATTAAATTRSPTVVAEAPAAWAASSGRSTASAGGLFPRRARPSKSLAVSTPTNAKGLMEGRHPRQTNPVLFFEHVAALQPSGEENCPRVITSGALDQAEGGARRNRDVTILTYSTHASPLASSRPPGSKPRGRPIGADRPDQASSHSILETITPLDPRKTHK